MEYMIERLKMDIDTGHRLLRHGGKCSSPHGHRYSVELAVAGPVLEDAGYLVDFSVLKARLGTWLDDNWDHTMILEAGDPLIAAMYGVPIPFPAGDGTSVMVSPMMLIGRVAHRDGPPASGPANPLAKSAVGEGRRACYILPYAPSSENLARYLYEVVCPQLFREELNAKTFRVVHVRIWETPNCVSTFPAPPQHPPTVAPLSSLVHYMPEPGRIECGQPTEGSYIQQVMSQQGTYSITRYADGAQAFYTREGVTCPRCLTSIAVSDRLTAIEDGLRGIRTVAARMQTVHLGGFGSIDGMRLGKLHGSDAWVLLIEPTGSRLTAAEKSYTVYYRRAVLEEGGDTLFWSEEVESTSTFDVQSIRPNASEVYNLVNKGRIPQNTPELLGLNPNHDPSKYIGSTADSSNPEEPT